MPNISRNTYKINKGKGYVSLRLQQGVPLVDADINEMEDIRRFEHEDFIKSFVGNGVPDDDSGFCIQKIQGIIDDFKIGKGKLLVGGMCVNNENEEFNYLDQNPEEPLSIDENKTYIVYLDVWEEEVNYEIDNDLIYNKIGVETCTRIKRKWFVRVGTELPDTAAGSSFEGHTVYTLAELTRNGNNLEIEDRRRTGLKLSSLMDEIKESRGNNTKLDNRLDVSLTHEGQLKNSGGATGVVSFMNPRENPISRFINPGLGEGPICVILGLEKGENGPFFIGSKEISEILHYPNVDLGCVVFPSLGKFKVGIQRNDNGIEPIRVRWWAFRPAVDRSEISSEYMKVAELILDSDKKYTLRTGEILNLGGGYALTAKQVDVEGDKVWLEFSKDGESVAEAIIEVDGGNDWVVALDDIEEENDVIVLKVHVNQVFQGAVDSIAQIEGLWLIDYENAFTIKSGDTFGELKVTDIGYNFLEFRNYEQIRLSRDRSIELAEGLRIEVFDNEELKFYLVNRLKNIKTCTKRGFVKIGEEAAEYNYSNYPEFYYDPNNEGIFPEKMSFEISRNGDHWRVDESALKYNTLVQRTPYKYQEDGWEEGSYPALGFFAEKHVLLKNKAGISNISAKLLIDNDEKYTLRVGKMLDLGEGYALTAKHIDVEGGNVSLEFTKDGDFVADATIDVSSGRIEDKTWVVKLDNIEGENGVSVLRVHVNQVFQGAVDSIAQIEGLWLIDYENAMTIEVDQEFDELTLTEIRVDSLTFRNHSSIYLRKGETEGIAGDLKFRISNSEDLKYCLVKEKEYPEPVNCEIKGGLIERSVPIELDGDNFPGFFYDLERDVQTETLNIRFLDGRTIGVNNLVYRTEVKELEYKFQEGDWKGKKFNVVGFFGRKYVNF
ncbi:MAG: S-layer protein domain-containing protein [Methanosarcinaceae archaeon]